MISMKTEDMSEYCTIHCTYRRRGVCVHELRILRRTQVQDGLNLGTEKQQQQTEFKLSSSPHK